MIQEKIGLTKETFIVEGELLNFKNWIEDKYPFLKNLPYKIAVNNEIVQNEVIINQDVNVALLPPYAGG